MKTITIKNVADLDKVVKICNEHGANYTPGNEALLQTALTSLLVVAQEKLKAVNDAHAAAATKLKDRRVSFRAIPALATRIVQLVVSCQATPGEQMQAREIKRKYFIRNTYKSIKTRTLPAEGSEVQPKSPRANYLDYASQLDGLEQLVQMVSTISSYKPVEEALKIEGLKKTLVELHASYDAAEMAKVHLTEARVARNRIIAEPGGVSERVKAFKGYMRAKFGYGNLTLKQL